MNYARKPQPLPVAEVKPGDFPLGSMESRAAARALAERKNEGKRILMIQFIPARDGHPDVEKMSNPPRLIRRVEAPDSVTGFWGWDDQWNRGPTLSLDPEACWASKLGARSVPSYLNH